MADNAGVRPEQLSLGEIVSAGLCTGCGACVALDATGASRMQDSPFGPRPHLVGSPQTALDCCPGKGIDYPDLYRRFYGRLPDNWLTGPAIAVRTGHAADESIRRAGASGGVLTSVLIHLLESGRIDGAIVARQGLPTAENARSVIAVTRQEVVDAAQSVYIPVAMLDRLRDLEPGKRYAITCLPDQAAALRLLQLSGHEQARQVRYVLGPYTGTALYPAAIRSFLRSAGVADDDVVESLKWRAGEWPGCLEVRTRAGRTLQSDKFYYNYLIPFFITSHSLASMDFANEFCDLSVGDAWSPAFEAKRGGYSVITTRSAEMEGIVQEMLRQGLLTAEPIDERKAAEMHGHMIDFKKRGGYLRNRFRRSLGLPAADFGMKPSPLPLSRVLAECVISCMFLLGGTRFCRWLVERIPERVIGPVFNRLRLFWKSASRPTKRKGLGNLVMIPNGRVP